MMHFKKQKLNLMEENQSQNNKPNVIKIGVLAVQGAFYEHINMLEKLNEEYKNDHHQVIIQPIEIRTSEQLEPSYGLHGLIIPGGESTTISLVTRRLGLWESLINWTSSDRPTWGTCAGLILLSKNATHTKKDGQPLLEKLDIQVDRNYYGSQSDSFMFPIAMNMNKKETMEMEQPFNGIFIRAPMITSLLSEKVKPLAFLSKTALKKEENSNSNTSNDPIIVAVQQDHFLGTTFHPELTNDTRWHRYFIQMILEKI